MSSYLIWNPYVADKAPPTVDLFLTCVDLWRIYSGSDCMVQEILDDIGVDDPVTGWSLTRWRCGYFSDYRSGDWEVRWSEVWQLRTTLPEVPWLDEVSVHGYLRTDAVDNIPLNLVPRKEDPSTFTLVMWPSYPSTPCLVLADFLDLDALEHVRTQVAALVPDAEMSVGSGIAQAPQLRIDLGDRPNAFYEEGAGIALEVEALCETYGGITWASSSTVRACS